MRFFHGRLGSTGGSSFPASSSSETCFGLASSTELLSAGAAVKRYAPVSSPEGKDKSCYSGTLFKRLVFDAHCSFYGHLCCFPDGAVLSFSFQVMDIVPSHLAWQRERSEHHSGAQRQYGERDHTRIPRGPFASPVPCSLCKRGAASDQGPGSAASPSRGSSNTNHAFPQPFNFALSLEVTPPRAAACLRRAAEAKYQTHPSVCCGKKVSQ